MRDSFAKLSAFVEQHLALVLISLPLAIVLVMLLVGYGLPEDKDTPILISEVYANPKEESGSYWIELYNNTDEPVDLAGWVVRAADESSASPATLQGATNLAPGGYLLVPADPQTFASQQPILAAGAATPSQPLHWRADGATIELFDPRGNRIDQVRWPTGTTPPALPAPSLVRQTVGLDTNQDSDWRASPQASPGSHTLPTIKPSTRFLLLEVTNYISLIGGFLLWAAFVIIGLIARRFEMLTGQRTFWQAMVIAPVGIVIYNLIQTRGFFLRGAMTDCRLGTERSWVFSFDRCEQLWSFVPLFIAAVVMTYVILLFYRAARRILEV